MTTTNQNAPQEFIKKRRDENDAEQRMSNPSVAVRGNENHHAIVHGSDLIPDTGGNVIGIPGILQKRVRIT